MNGSAQGLERKRRFVGLRIDDGSREKVLMDMRNHLAEYEQFKQLRRGNEWALGLYRARQAS